QTQLVMHTPQQTIYLDAWDELRLTRPRGFRYPPQDSIGATMSDSNKISRRDFAVSAALATAAIAATPTGLLAQEKTAAEAAKQEAPQPPKLSAASQAEVEERYAAVLRKYGSR